MINNNIVLHFFLFNFAKNFEAKFPLHLAKFILWVQIAGRYFWSLEALMDQNKHSEALAKHYEK